MGLLPPCTFCVKPPTPTNTSEQATNGDQRQTTMMQMTSAAHHFLDTKLGRIFVQSLAIHGRSTGTQRGVYQPLCHSHLIVSGVPVPNAESIGQSAGRSAGTPLRVYLATPVSLLIRPKRLHTSSVVASSTYWHNCSDCDSPDLLSGAAELPTVTCLPGGVSREGRVPLPQQCTSKRLSLNPTLHGVSNNWFNNSPEAY